MPCCASPARYLFLIVLLLATAGSGRAETGCTPARFANQALLSAMQRGVNLTGWDGAEPERRPTLKQLRALRDANFTHIRLPIDHTRLEGGDSADYLSAIYDQTITLLSLGYAVSLDLHAGGALGPDFAAEPEAAFAHLAGLWDRLTPLARSLDPAKVAIELLNEPEMDQALWMTSADRLVRRLRAQLPEHTIVVGPAGPQRHETLVDMEPLVDRNVVYAVHYYDPFVFTHQGMDWGAAGDPMRLFGGLPFPANLRSPAIRDALSALKAKGETQAAALLEQSLEPPWDEAMARAAFDMMASWSRRTGRPVIVNEFGVLTFAVPRPARLRWLAMVAGLARARCIGWTHWDFQDGFGLMDPETHLPDGGVMKALGASTK